MGDKGKRTKGTRPHLRNIRDKGYHRAMMVNAATKEDKKKDHAETWQGITSAACFLFINHERNQILIRYMTQNLFSVLGYNDFWEKFDSTFPMLEPAWYEVYIDFMDDVYNPSLPEEQNLWNAYKYIDTHRSDYD